MARPKVNVTAVIVTYFPVLTILHEAISSVSTQVEAVVLIDNGSPPHVVSSLRTFASDEIHLITLEENVGIAKAQNIGIRWSRQQGSTHVLLVDQDSRAPTTMVRSLVQVAFDEAAKGNLVALIAPRFVDDRQTFRRPFFRVNGTRPEWLDCHDSESALEIDTAISSGSLISIDSLDKIGELEEGLFIDLVDIEWCFRARSMGYRIYAACGTILNHHLGQDPLILFGWHIPRHSPLRNYYFYRNATLLFRRKYVPKAWKRAIALALVKRYLLYAIAVPPRLEYMRLMAIGIWHGLTKRMGKLNRVTP